VKTRSARFVRGRTPTHSSTSWARARIERAVIELSREQRLDDVTVRAICARAGFGRHTFFQLFGSLDEAKAAALQSRNL